MKKHTLTLFAAVCFIAALVPGTLTAQVSTTDSIGKAQGVFSVSPTLKVRFAPGNLQYQPYTHLWRFAPEQTAVEGWQEGYASPRYKGWIDLFGWGTGMNPTNYSTSPEEYSYVEWGLFCALPTSDGKQWRTLGLDEWTYLLSKRPRARRLYALAYVCGHYGMVLLPDGWRCPKGIYMRTGPKEEGTNVYNEEKWKRLEESGAIFLPAETKRMGTEAAGSANACRYWTSSVNAKKGTEAIYLLVDPYLPQAKSASKATGMSVRLVQDIEN